MNWFKFLPPLFSIYLLLASSGPKTYLKRSVSRFLANKKGMKDKVEIVQNVALDWSARSGFIHSMLAAILSPISIFSESQNYIWLATTILLLLLIFASMLWWIFSKDPDELVASKMARLEIKPSTFCKLILFIINLILIAAIYESEKISRHSVAQP